MRQYILFDGVDLDAGMFIDKIADGNAATFFGGVGKFWAFYVRGCLWEGYVSDSHKDYLCLRNICGIRGASETLLDGLSRLSGQICGISLDVEKVGGKGVVVRPYINV